jgi:hypothetical protein
MLIGWVWWATLAVCGLVVAWRRGSFRAQLRVQALVAATYLLVFGAILGFGRADRFEGLPERPLSDLYTYSARPLMYVLPTEEHPLLGERMRPVIYRHFSAGPGQPLVVYNPNYLGIVTMLLAFLGLLALWWRRRAPLSARERMAGAVLVVAAVSALAWSGPPTIGVLGFNVPLPNRLVMEFTTAFRGTARFGHLVMLATCVLAAIGVRQLLARRPVAVQALCVGVLAVLIGVDGWFRQPGRTRVSYPPTVEALASQPRGIVAHYPLAAGADTDSLVTFYQLHHRQPLFNGYRGGSRASARALEVMDLWGPGAAAKLRRLGVRYVLARVSPPLDPPLLRPGQTPDGLEEIATDETGTLYRVTAPPARTWVAATAGFSLPTAVPGGFVKTLVDREGEIEVEADCERCSGTLRFNAGAAADPRLTIVRDGAGREIARRTIGHGPVTVRIPLRFSRRIVLHVTTEPRSPSILIETPMRFIPDPGTLDDAS